MNWWTIIGLVFQLANAAEQDAVEVAADQPVVSPPVYVTLDGHKYEATLHLDPVAPAPAEAPPT
jgi:hypothetical protein